MTMPKEALERLRRDMLMYIDAGVADDDLSHTVKVSHINFVQWHDLCDAALASLEGDAVERVARIPHAEVDKIVSDLMSANYSDKPRLAVAVGRAIVKANERGLATGLVLDEAAIRADEREKCAKNDLLDAMQAECWTLRCVDIPTGCGDADVVWEVVQHHMAKPHDRVIATGSTPREALAAAIRAGRGE